MELWSPFGKNYSLKSYISHDPVVCMICCEESVELAPRYLYSKIALDPFLPLCGTKLFSAVLGNISYGFHSRSQQAKYPDVLLLCCRNTKQLFDLK